MAIHLPGVLAKQRLSRSFLGRNRSASRCLDVPKGFLAVYVGEAEKKRFVVPLSYLNEPAFQELLSKVEEDFDFDHPMGGLTIACTENMFVDVTCCLIRY